MRILGISFRAALFACVVLAGRVEAQSASLSGFVIADSTERPIANAEILLAKWKLSTRSDAKGSFQLSGVPSGKQEVTVRLVGHEPVVTTMDFVPAQHIEVDFLLKPLTTRLEAVDVKAEADTRYAFRLRDFERRRAFGMGQFLTAETFEKNAGRMLSEVLVSLVPGVNTVGRNSQKIIVARRGAACAVQVVMNGITIFNGREPNFDINNINTGEVIGVEYYTLANTPSQFSATQGGRGGRATAPVFNRGSYVAGGSSCGTIVIWTK